MADRCETCDWPFKVTDGVVAVKRGSREGSMPPEPCARPDCPHKQAEPDARNLSQTMYEKATGTGPYAKRAERNAIPAQADVEAAAPTVTEAMIVAGAERISGPLTREEIVAAFLAMLEASNCVLVSRDVVERQVDRCEREAREQSWANQHRTNAALADAAYLRGLLGNEADD